MSGGGVQQDTRVHKILEGKTPVISVMVEGICLSSHSADPPTIKILVISVRWTVRP